MPEFKPPTEIVRGAEVVISKRLGIAENEAKALGSLKVIRSVNAEGLKAWDDVGLKVGAKGIVECVYEDGFSDVLFDPTEVIKKPFSYAVPTACLSLR